jgi:pimeloyl-ACP methyl ester carboxylesterase
MQVLIPVGEETISLQIHGKPNLKKCIFILPPGGLNFDHEFVQSLFDKYDYRENLSDYQIIILDYPGISKAPPCSEASVEKIAELCIQHLKNQIYGEIILVGFSFGGSVVTEMVDLEPQMFKKIIVAASGEYLNFPIKQIAILLGRLTLLSPKFNYFMYFMLVKALRVFNEFHLNSLENLIQMGRSIFSYKLSPQIHTVEALLIFLQNDKIVRVDSVEKLKNKFPNHIETKISVRHTKQQNLNEVAVIETLIKTQIVPFISK